MSLFSFPLPKAYMGGSWSLDQGVDINGGTSAIADQPLLAVGSGTIVKHGIQGFGPSAPVLKLDTPIAGQDYVYYGHAGPGGMLADGTHVTAGQPIGQVGAGIVGLSSGPHLEIGFSDLNGTPVPGTSSIMDKLLKTGSALPVSATTGSTGPSGGTGGTGGGGGILGSGVGPNFGPDLNPVDAVNKALSSLFDQIVSKAKYAALVAVLVIGGFVLMGKGIQRTTHAGAS